MNQTQSLFLSNQYKINDKISVYSPTVGEIFEFGDKNYYSLIQGLVSTPYELMVELDEIGIDFETLSDYQLFLLMMESIALGEDDTTIIFPNIDLKNFRETINEKNGERILYDDTNDIIIDESIALEIQNGIRKIHFLEKTLDVMGNAEAKEYILEKNKRKKKRAKKQPYKSFLEDIIVSLVNTEEFKYDYETVMGLSIYKLNISLRQISRKKNWEQTMTGVYSGGIDMKKLNLSKISWLSPD